MTAAPSPSSSGTAEVNPFANEPPASSPTPQIVGGVREALKLGCYMTACAGDDEYQIKIGFASLADMQSAHSALVAALAPQAQDGGVAQPSRGTAEALIGAELARWCYDNPNLAARTIEGLRDAAQAAPEPVAYHIEHDGFKGIQIGSYTTLEGKEGVVLQQSGTRVVHVYGRKWVSLVPSTEGK